MSRTEGIYTSFKILVLCGDKLSFLYYQQGDGRRTLRELGDVVRVDLAEPLLGLLKSIPTELGRRLADVGGGTKVEAREARLYLSPLHCVVCCRRLGTMRVEGGGHSEAVFGTLAPCFRGPATPTWDASLRVRVSLQLCTPP